MVTRAITKAQKRVEARNFEIRKNLLEYDEVMDIQRKEVYGLRTMLLEGDDEHQTEAIESFIEIVDRRARRGVPGEWRPGRGAGPREVARRGFSATSAST